MSALAKGPVYQNILSPPYPAIGSRAMIWSKKTQAESVLGILHLYPHKEAELGWYKHKVRWIQISCVLEAIKQPNTTQERDNGEKPQI